MARRGPDCSRKSQPSSRVSFLAGTFSPLAVSIIFVSWHQRWDPMASLSLFFYTHPQLPIYPPYSAPLYSRSRTLRPYSLLCLGSVLCQWLTHAERGL